jgi:hypothetical protein
LRLDSAKLAAYSRLFSAAVIRELASRGKSPLFAKLARQSLVPDGLCSTGNVGDAYQIAFDVLKVRNNRDEYTYRAALTEKVLLGKHSLNTASMLTEFRVAACKADVVILNGTSTVYEIKSERDSLARLARQVEAYGKVFAKTYVIAGENHTKAVLDSTATHVGVMQLTSRHSIREVREAHDRAEMICPLTVFDSIRIEEAKELLRILGRTVPSIPNTLLRAEMRKEFASLPPALVHSALVNVLKKSRGLAPLKDFVEALPSALKAAALTSKLKQSERERLIGAVRADIQEALRWA